MKYDENRFDPEVLQEAGRIDLIARTIVQGIAQGIHRSRQKGFSTEFRDHRPYVEGDDLRFLDWHVYGRTNRLFVKCFQAETSLEVTLLLDATGSMAWRWKNHISKLEYAGNLLAALALLHIRSSDRVGLMVHDAGQMHILPPRAQRKQLEGIFSVLTSLSPGGGDSFYLLARELADARRHRGRVIICSDLEEDEESVADALSIMGATGNEIILFHILDSAEIVLPFADSTCLKDSETGELLPVNIRKLQAEHQQCVRDFRARWQLECETRKIVYVPMDTGMRYDHVILEMMERRNRS